MSAAALALIAAAGNRLVRRRLFPRLSLRLPRRLPRWPGRRRPKGQDRGRRERHNLVFGNADARRAKVAKAKRERALASVTLERAAVLCGLDDVRRKRVELICSVRPPKIKSRRVSPTALFLGWQRLRSDCSSQRTAPCATARCRRWPLRPLHFITNYSPASRGRPRLKQRYGREARACARSRRLPAQAGLAKIVMGCEFSRGNSDHREAVGARLRRNRKGIDCDRHHNEGKKRPNEELAVNLEGRCGTHMGRNNTWRRIQSRRHLTFSRSIFVEFCSLLIPHFAVTMPYM